MVEVRYEIESSLELGLRFEIFPDQLHDDLLEEITALGREAYDAAAVTVPRRTGRLASQERIRIFDQPERVAAVVDFDGGDAKGNDAAKAGALEYGSRGDPLDIHAHVRRVESAFRRPYEYLVHAYTRVPNIAEHRFARRVVDQIRGEAVSRLEAVIERRVDALNKELK